MFTSGRISRVPLEYRHESPQSSHFHFRDLPVFPRISYCQNEGIITNLSPFSRQNNVSIGAASYQMIVCLKWSESPFWYHTPTVSYRIREIAGSDLHDFPFFILCVHSHTITIELMKWSLIFEVRSLWSHLIVVSDDGHFLHAVYTFIEYLMRNLWSLI